MTQNLEKLKAIANYRYQKGDFNTLKEIIEVEKLIQNDDKKELEKLKKLFKIVDDCFKELTYLQHKETCIVVSKCIKTMILEAGLDTSKYDKIFETLIETDYD